MDPCKVCGGTDLNLVDGFYYCVECGTQDVNIQETVVEQTAIGDGTFAHATVRKFTTAVHDGVEMSGEWHKWYLFNFLLAGLTDELIALGAKPSLKMKVLWVWSKYIKMFQVKDESQSKSKLDIGDDSDEEILKDDEDKDDSGNNDSEDEEQKSEGKTKKSKSETFNKDVKVITKGTLLAILYVALNLDRSNIQLSHLLRFVKEDRLSLNRFRKFVPKELDTKLIKNWKSFLHSLTNFNPTSIRAVAMTYFKRLKLGVPTIPDFSKLVKNYVKELCLPVDFQDLVFALMHYVPFDFLDVDSKSQKSLIRIPDYEGVCMAYVLVALKMCFGLDDDYDMRLSQEVDKVNEEENYLKSYKLGMFSEPTDRLFSFNDWCQHIQFRKLMLCKYYFPMSRQFNATPDDYVFIEHLEPRNKREIKLSDEVTMDILNKIKSDEESQVIPKDKFPVTLTPMTCYVDVIAQYVQDPDLKLLLCEDFTQYSIKYAVRDLYLQSHLNDAENLVTGVSESGKVFNDHVIGTLKEREGDTTLVYVRNCQNKNWLKTKPPTVDHITKITQNENSSDNSDHGYDSNVECANPESEATHISINEESTYVEDKKLEILEELDVDKSIFDDNFTGIPVQSFNENILIKEERVDEGFEIHTQSNPHGEDIQLDQCENLENYEDSDISTDFNPNNFNREKMIKELIELARKKYRIPAPRESDEKEPKKRKANLVNEEATSSEPKKKKTENRLKPGEAKEVVNNLVAKYYNNLQNDVLNQVSEQIKSLLENVDNNNLENDNPENLNESRVLDAQNELNNSIFSSFIENEESQTDVNTNNDGNPAQNDEDTNAKHPNADQASIDESADDEIVDEFLKSDPNFDEKDHDIKQLYVKLGEDLDNTDISLEDLENDPEVDKIIQKSIKKFSNIDKCAPDECNILDVDTEKCKINKSNIADVIDDISESSDSDDDIPLNVLKETIQLEEEKQRKKKEKLESLVRNPSNIKSFNYWVRHYRARCVERSRDMNKKFDLELKENLPKSFVLVIHECAALLGCSAFSLYRNVQKLEEILLR